jgi:hypothetical protein
VEGGQEGRAVVAASAAATLAPHAGLGELTGARQAIAQVPHAYAKALVIDGPSRRTSRNRTAGGNAWGVGQRECGVRFMNLRSSSHEHLYMFSRNQTLIARNSSFEQNSLLYMYILRLYVLLRGYLAPLKGGNDHASEDGNRARACGFSRCTQRIVCSVQNQKLQRCDQMRRRSVHSREPGSRSQYIYEVTILSPQPQETQKPISPTFPLLKAASDCVGGLFQATRDQLQKSSARRRTELP